MMRELANHVSEALKVDYVKVIYHDGSKPKEEVRPRSSTDLRSLSLQSSDGRVLPASGSQGIRDTLNSLKRLPYEIIASIAGAETGVPLNDILAERLGLLGNGTQQSQARRDKYLMGETVRSAGEEIELRVGFFFLSFPSHETDRSASPRCATGLRAVKQKLATKWSDIQEFLDVWKPNPFKVVVKPVNSAGRMEMKATITMEKPLIRRPLSPHRPLLSGSDDVFKCTSMDELKAAFGCIMGKINGLGLENKAVLVQEYLDGIEYGEA